MGVRYLNPIIAKVRNYLDAAVRGEAVMSPSVIEEATRQFKRSLDRQFNKGGKRNFTLRMSNVGKPICQLWHDKAGTPAEPESYNFIMKMVIGDALEAITGAVLSSAGVGVTATDQRVKLVLDIDGNVEEVFGSYDISIDEGDGEKIWDIKSCSSFAFTSKFNSPYGYKNLSEEDPFGYINQGFGYEEAGGKPFAGWIAVNKETGEFAALEVPSTAAEVEKPKALEAIAAVVKEINSDGPFPGRCFEDEPETFRSKPTGNRVLGRQCGYCPYKWACWEGLKQEPQKASKAASPKLVYYTHIEEAE